MTGGKKVVLWAGLLAAIAIAAPAGALPPHPGSPTAEITDVHAHPGHVQFLISVRNLPQGSSLDPASIDVTADGTQLAARATLGGAKPDGTARPIREAVLALDASGSMQGDGIAAARKAALAYASGLPSDVRVGLVVFNDKPHVLLRPTADRRALASAVGRVSAGGNTALYDGVLTAGALMNGLPADAERRLLILSDGDDTASTHSLGAAAQDLRAARIAADVVAFRLPGDRSALNTIATQSGGRVLPATSAADLAGVFSKAASVFSQQLLVTADVPNALAAHRVTIVAKVRAGASTISSSTSSKLAALASAPKGTPARRDGASDSRAPSAADKTQLWIIAGLSFVAIFVVALSALLVPVMNRTRAKRQARLAEIQRYRVVGAIGNYPQLTDFRGVPVAAQGAITQRALSVVDRTVRARGQRERLVSELERAGLRMRPEEWAVMQLAGILVAGVTLTLITGSIIGLVAGFVIGWLAARAFIRIKISRRQDKFADQLPDTLQLLASSLRTGFSLNQALGGVVRDGTEPTASEFARALTEVRIGSDLEDAIDDVAERMNCEDLTWVVMAVRISREVGGNLAETLQTTVQTMRQRAELRGQVRVLTAEGRISARVLTALPFLLAGVLSFIRPGYLTPLFTKPMGIALLCVGSGLLALGTFWLSRLVKIKV